MASSDYFQGITAADKFSILKAREADQHWLQQFPKFENLQILRLEKPSSQNFIEKIAECRHLQVADVVFDKLDNTVTAQSLLIE
ncbi:hypothetical protein VE04_03325 [Pseudogymnoascus sp. 24MN13]|nr:hypothetical protein VE04_03325 [Pseudogymnoascus sp. 24MN13]